jgi:sugar lactone lactonase YvrE
MKAPLGFLVLAGAIGLQSLPAAGPAVWEMSTYKDFIGGVFRNVSLGREGRLTLGPELKTVFASEQPLLWSLAQAPDGTVYLGTGHRGRVYRVARDGTSKLFWEATEPEVFALVVGPDGNLYAGTSPDGKVYRINPAGQGSEFFNPASKYIWSLVFGRDRALYVGTGDRGRIFRVDAGGKGDLYYDTQQTHVTSLAIDRQGALLAGTDPNAILYRVSARDKAFVLYDAPLAEIRSIQVAPDGAVYVAAMGGAASRASQPPAGSGAGDTAIPPLVQSITVVASAEAQQPPRPQPDAPKPSATPATPPTAAPQATPSAPAYPGGQRSALLRVAPDDTVETLWTSNEANVYALLPQKSGLLFSTDEKGRIYRLDASRQVTLVAQAGEEETARLADLGDAVLAATSNLGKLYRMDEGPASLGTYEAPVRDTGTVSRWGRLSWKAQLSPGAALEFSTRSGNTSRPDATWSDWSPPLRNPDGSPVASPTARFIQWRAELRGGRGVAPVLESVSLAYLPQNTAPVIRSILVVPTQTSAAVAGPSPSAGPSAAADFSVTVTDTGASSAATNPGTPTTTLSRGAIQSQVTSISWQAEDPDGDKLSARVSFRPEGQSGWILLKENLTDPYVSLDPDVLADGVYQVKVAVTDALSNPAATAREAELISAPFLVDNTPPLVRPARVERSGAKATVRFEVEDAASMLRRAEYSLDAGPWTPVYPDDGILDSRTETFTVVLENLKPGEHLITFRSADAAGNAGLGKALVR